MISDMTLAAYNLIAAAGQAPAWDPAWDGALSIGIFIATLLLVLAVFGSGGRIQLSPQREAALATGEADRKTVFEQPILRPVMWIFVALGHRLAIPRTKSWLRRQIVAAGSPNYYTAEEYLALAVMTGLVLGLLLSLGNLLVYGTHSIPALMLGLAAGAGLTLYKIYDDAAKRVRLIWRRLPYALDLIALAMGAGATFAEAVRTITRETSDDPFLVELRTLLTEMDLGATRRTPLGNLARRVPLDSLRSIVASVIQAEELGTPLATVLHDQSTLLRLQRSVRAENAAAVAGVRILIPCLLLVFAVILSVFGSFIVRAIRGGLFT